MSPTAKSRLPMPASRPTGSPSSAAAPSIGEAPRAIPSSSGFRSLKKAFTFGRGNAGSKSNALPSGRLSGLPKSASTTALSKSLGSNSGAAARLATRRASGDHARLPTPVELQEPRPMSGKLDGNSWISYTSPSPKRTSPQPVFDGEHAKLQPITSNSTASSNSLSHLIEAEKAAGSSDEMLVAPTRPNPQEAFVRQASTPPPSIPLPAIPTTASQAGSEAQEAGPSILTPTGEVGQPASGDSYTFPYALAAAGSERLSMEGSQVGTNWGRAQEANSPEPILVESPSKSPSVVDGSRHFVFSTAVADNDDGEGDREHLPTQEERDAELHTSLSRLRHSSSSPLSELVTRLSMHSPSRSASMNTLANDGSLQVDASKPEAGKAFLRAPSPFANADREDDARSAVDAHSVDGSSGISVAGPPKRTAPADLVSQQGQHIAEEQLPSIALERPPSVQQDSLPRRVSSNTQQRWSIHELEEAYGRMRAIAVSRKGSGMTDAPSLLLSETDDSREIETSYLRNLLNEVDRSELQSSQNTELAMSRNRLAEEATDSLTPLLNEGRYSPAPRSPNLAPRSPSPMHRAKAASPTHAAGHARTDSLDTPTVASTRSSSSGTPSGGTGVYTNPTTVRSSSQEIEKTPTAASFRRRSSPAAGLGIDAKRKASIEYSVAESDDTGWQTPRTSIDDTLSRRRSVSPNLAAVRRRSSATEHEIPLPQRSATIGVRPRRPMSFSSGTSVESALQQRSATVRHQQSQDLLSRTSANSTIGWVDEQSRAGSKIRPSLPFDPRANASTTRLRETSQTGSTFSIETGSSVTLADAKRADRLELFLRCTKAEAAHNALMGQYTIEKAAMLDAIQEYKQNAEMLKQANDALEDELDEARHNNSSRKQWQARIAEVVEARDTWQARAQAAERDLRRAEATAADQDNKARFTISSLQKEIEALKQQLAAAKAGPGSPKGSSLPRARVGTRLPSSSSTSGLSKIGSGLPKATSSLPRSRTVSAGSSIASSAAHGRSVSGTSSTNFGDHLPPPSDGWTPDGSIMDLSLHLDEQTDKFLRDLDEESVRSRQP